jgi:transposase-like protein
MRTGGMEPLGSFLAKRHMQGVSLRLIAQELFQITGVQVSHETIRSWIREG